MVLSKLTLLVVGHKNLTLIDPTFDVAIFIVLHYAGQVALSPRFIEARKFIKFHFYHEFQEDNLLT